MSKTVYFGVGLIPLALPRLILALGLERALLFSGGVLDKGITAVKPHVQIHSG